MNKLHKEVEELGKLRLEILQIRDTGETNMFDTKEVERLAYYYNCHRLVNLLHENPSMYLKFIMTGWFY
ncbi:DUF5049 domain-containing protein [Limosilactobacillus fermentum]|uniref:DUF5049 domain-containing protein n=1 Tax=Limosilactobacillus fermentum TaxID=1613 RepID=A0A843QZ60_LIMFE|nr:DUF5049 domain-containing protein [Limosilactobacillus fermentum]MPQ35082.1 DUF5049 domain-containing protein [Limosilactobacillus fermentum]